MTGKTAAKSKDKSKSLAQTSPAHSLQSTGGSLTTKLTERHQDDEISPELAAKVVKAYILPMLQGDSRSSQAKTRGVSLGNLVGGLETLSTNGSVLGELRLSEQLLKQQQDLQGELKDAQLQLMDRHQSFQTERADMQNRLMLAASNVEFLRLQYEQQQSQLKSAELGSSLMTSEVLELKRQIEDLKSEKSSFIAQLDKLRSQSDALKRSEEDAESTGARFPGMHDAIEGLVSRHGVEEALIAEYKNSGVVLAKFKAYAETLEQSLKTALDERDELLVAFSSEPKSAPPLSQPKPVGVSGLAKEQMRALEDHNKRLEATCDDLVSELERMTRNYKDLAAEYQRLRASTTTVKMPSPERKVDLNPPKIEETKELIRAERVNLRCPVSPR
jgi:chromosome segregation ATPase